MAKELRYSLTIRSHFHIENFLGGHNNQTNDSFFWLEEHDHGVRNFYFSSALLSELELTNEIYHRAKQILSIFEGVYKLLDRNRNADTYFTIENIIDLNSGHTISNRQNSEIYKVDVDFSTIIETPENNPKNPVYVLFEKIIKDAFLINLFFLLSNKVDYRMLYIIYDDIKFYLKEQKDDTFLKPFEKELKRFGHTANNYEVLGFFARHGRANNDPPSSPMTLEESKNLIFDVIVKLLDEKLAIKLPDFWGMMYIDFSSVDLEDIQNLLTKEKKS